MIETGYYHVQNPPRYRGEILAHIFMWKNLLYVKSPRARELFPLRKNIRETWPPYVLPANSFSLHFMSNNELMQLPKGKPDE